ncbi:MAG: ribonuclease III domain-containing protein [Eubacteriales bacterium]|nr:ribonuclease III domain-containing protein [Eubacteriales bacterium]
MTDFLHPSMDNNQLRAMSSLALAHMGDCVYEIMTRSWLTTSGLVTNRNLHRETIRLVCAGAQAAGAAAILPLLTEEEEDVFRRGRNSKPKSVPKTSSVSEYAHATAVEALFGWLYLRQEYARLNELFAALLPAAQEWAAQKKKQQ